MGLRVALVLIGVAGLLAKPHYAGPLAGLVWSYAGNASAWLRRGASTG